MRAFFASIFGYFLSPLGLLLLAALDTSMLFFLPFAVDAAVIFLTARRPEWMLLYAALATAGSLIGAAGTFWIGRRAGEHGLERLVSRRRLAHVKHQVGDRGAIALAVPSLVPPPFPFKLFVVTAGVFRFSLVRFMLAIVVGRAFRFLLEGYFAVRYGAQAKEILARYYPFIGIGLAVVIILFLVVKRFIKKGEASVEQTI